MRVFIFELTILFWLISVTLSARILLIGSTLKLTGHQMELLGIGEELAQRGHEVYISISNRTTADIETSRRMAWPNITQLYYILKKDYSFMDELNKNTIQKLFNKDITHSILPEDITGHGQNMTNECEEALTDSEFIQKLKYLKLDLVLVSRFPFSQCFHIIPYFLKVPFVSIGTAFEPWFGGFPTLPSFTYNPLLNYNDKMNFWQRLANFLSITGISTAINCDINVRSHHHLLKKFAPGMNSFKAIVDQSQLFFVTREHVVQWPLPTMPNVITVPSVGCLPSKPLPNELNKIASSSKYGVIVVSFGSESEYLPREVIAKLAAAFKDVRQDVIWKFPFKGANPAEFLLSRNVHTTSWFPQNDLLGCNNTKLFITHCGNNGQYESIYQGVPMVAFPLFGDQHHNAFRMKYHGFGIALDIAKFTPEELVRAINEVIENSTYSDNVKKASVILKNAPMTARATIAYWMEHVIKFGHHHLRSHAMNLAWYEYFMIDVLAVVSTFIGVTMYLIVKLILCCCRQGHKNKQLNAATLKEKAE